MIVGIINNSGNVLEWFDDEASARAALEEMLAEYPGADGQVDLIRFDDSGDFAGRPSTTVTALATTAPATVAGMLSGGRLIWGGLPVTWGASTPVVYSGAVPQPGKNEAAAGDARVLTTAA